MKKSVLVCIVVFCFSGVVYSEEQILAEVGDQKITLKDFQEMVLQYEKSKSFQGKLLALTPEGKKKILEEMIKNNLFYQAARDGGITLKEETEKEIELMRRQLLIRRYIEQELQKKPITDDDLKGYYDKHREEFTIPEQRKLTHVVVKMEQEAEKIAREIKAGKDFGSLAEQYNTDGTKKKKGDLGWVKKGVMVKEFENVAFQLKKGEISNIVKTKFGYHIIKVEDIKPQEQKKYEDVREEIRRKIRGERLKEIEEQLRDQYKVQINEELLSGGEK